MKKFILKNVGKSLLLASILLMTTFISSCTDEPDDVPDYDVHMVQIQYGQPAFLYEQASMSNSIYFNTSSGGLWGLINCELVSEGPIVIATTEKIEIDPVKDISSFKNSLKTSDMNPDNGFVVKAQFLTSSYNGQNKYKEIYYYVYFSDYSYNAAVGYYNPKYMHFQRFK